jgi:hypothetical protein
MTPQRALPGEGDTEAAADGDDEGECEWCSEVGQLWVIGVWAEVEDAEGAAEVDTWLCNRCAEAYLTQKERTQ